MIDEDVRIDAGGWICGHYSITVPHAEAPDLLRRLADDIGQRIETRSDFVLLNIVVMSEGADVTASVFFSPPSSA